jgi:peptidylprolyl isomerase
MRFLTSLIATFACFLSVPALAQDAAAPRAPVASPTDPENLLYLDLSTGGRVVIWLRPDVAPKTVERIKLLTRQRFYDGLAFHRVIEGFMAQGGDPKGDGTGGSTLPDLKAEFNYLPHVRGAVSAARAEGNDTANSQFFIVFLPRLQLDQKYTVFARVLSGMEFVDAIERGEPPANPSRILRAYIAADNPPPYQPQAAAVATPPVPAAPVLAPAAPARPRAAPKPAPRKR